MPEPSGQARTTTPHAPAPAGEAARQAERRQLTVLFADLIDSTRLSDELDPEDWDDVLRAYQRRCAEAIEAAGGFVAELQGDGVVGYFGYIQANENDAERAVRAGLAICDGIATGASPQGEPMGEPLAVRVGIATGLVVADTSGRTASRREQGAVGQTLNLAARLQGLAEANTVVIADATRRLIGSVFDCEDRGPLVLKGFADPVRVWRVIGPSLTRSRVRGEVEATPGRMVGRQAEMQAVLHAWHEARAGRGASIGIVGEAGLGKSHFVAEFRRHIAPHRQGWIEDGGSQFFAGTPFHPVSQAIRRIIDPGGKRPSHRFHARLKTLLRRSGVEHRSVLPAFADMLDLPLVTAELDALPPTSAGRALLFNALLDLIRAASRSGPLVIVIEDLHWVDASSSEFLDLLAGKIRSMPVLLLATGRLWPQPGLEVKAWSVLRLGPLADAELREIVSDTAAATGELTLHDLSGILERAGGVPLFGVELARLIREQRAAGGADARLGQEAVPASLADLLMARLDQLDTAKGVVQVCAVVGVQIPQAILNAVADLPEGELRSRIAVLRKQDVLHAANRQEDTYAFRHALLRDAAYGSLLKGRRRDLHRAVAVAIRDEAGASAASRASILAHHWINAGEVEASIEAWMQAGRYATDRHAFAEAEAAYGAALAALLQHLPASTERDRRELAVQSLYADVLRITQGISAPPTMQTTQRARALAEISGDSEERLQQAWGSWAAASSGGDFAAGLILAGEYERLAFASGLPRHLASAQMIQMTSRFRVGDIVAAEAAFHQGAAFYDDTVFQGQPGFLAQTFGNAALIAWTLGEDGQAETRIANAVFGGRAEDSPFAAVYGLLMQAAYLNLTGRYAEAADRAEHCIMLCDTYGIAQFAASTRVMLGRAKLGLGAAAEGVSLMRDGVADMQKAGVRVAMTRYLAWLAEGYLAAGRSDEALASAQAALTINRSELFYRPEAIRIRGLIHQKCGRFAEAEQDFREAMELARRMGAARLVERSSDNLGALQASSRLTAA